ncbi:MAG TPA: HD domain-containing protein [Lacunisphaera sp.]|jgi:hypothetical protein
MAPHAIDTKSPAAVVAVVKNAFALISAQASFSLLDRLFADVTNMFNGKHPGYLGIDMHYHDYEHTLQATVCLIKILEGRHRSGDKPILSARDWELAVIAVLLHDTGYLKHADDRDGTGAKYTMIHESRSCEFARSYLPSLGIKPAEIDDVCAAISCTGPQNKISQMTFSRENARIIAFILVTADYLGQMSAPDYVDELPMLFGEFEEAFEFEHVPEQKRSYHEISELLEKTPRFWENYVRPLLDFEAGGVHRYLTTAGQPNPYLQAVEANIAEVQRLVRERTGKK